MAVASSGPCILVRHRRFGGGNLNVPRHLLFLLLVAGCNGNGRDSGPLLDTGWFSSHDTGGCVDRISSVEPEAGTEDWYWRKNPVVRVNTELEEAYDARLIDAGANEHPVTLDWSGTRMSILLDEPLKPLSTYTLEVTDCNGKERFPFQTSRYGEPLGGYAFELQDRTYVYDMASADWVQPENFGAVISLYFTTPVLVGVQWANEENIDLIGTMGFQGPSGDFRQTPGVPTWNLPATSFSDKPYFEAEAEVVTVQAAGVSIDIYDFEISGTFSSDYSSIGGTRISGLGDTRNMGELIGKKGDPAAMCDLAATWSVPCEPCPDTFGYCMRLTAIDAVGNEVPGLSIKQIAP